ncbi:hypothetical protein [Micromonospora sp. AKA38]|uniref:hypothetical protein n=1 Tax=Micromonospora sp. AKA38 TaxID=2733861 RepID=UPI0022C2CD2C|nr:hypothetical protein [Micromonospora sp. AKA38]GHJ15889.1 hypothetical protein TPA0908_38840 [Micromonospora sp. AKA38]
MTSVEAGDLVERIRPLLTTESEWRMMNSLPLPKSDGGAVLPGVPSSYLEMLKIADGFICGPVVMFDSSTVISMQFYAENPEGSSARLTKEEWFCAGVVSDEPWFINRLDESIWLFPDTGVEWWMSEQFEEAAPSLKEFLVDVVCGPRYVSLTGAQEGDQWWRLLERVGRIQEGV